MDLAFITPTSYLDKFSKQGDIYLALAHLVDDNGQNEYSRFHRREAGKGKRVILDNGLFEGSQIESEALIHRARAIGASTVCAPDVLYDSKGTIKEFKKFIKLKHEVGLVADVMGIPQADNPTDWWDCFQFMDLHQECHLIGLSILSIPQSFKRIAKGADKQPITASRVHLLKQLSSFTCLSGHRITPCHMLGLGESYADIITAKKLLPSDIISNDSSSCFVHGAAGIVYDRFGYIPGGKILEKVDFDRPQDLEGSTHACIQANINVALGIRKTNWY